MEDKQTSNNEQLNTIIVEYKKMLQEKLAHPPFTATYITTPPSR